MESYVPLFEDFAAEDAPAYVSYTILKGEDGGVGGVMVNKWQADGRKYLSHTSEQEEDAAQGEVMKLGDGTWAEALRILDARNGDDLWIEDEPAIERIKQMIRMRLQWRRMRGDVVTRIYALGGAQDDAIFGGFGGGREWNMERGPWSWEARGGRVYAERVPSDADGGIGIAITYNGKKVGINEVSGEMRPGDLEELTDLLVKYGGGR